ncbi:unnamed protein product [Owenia fusiformis]|uniref:Uncharacterized protein n=1 Tax=Owenia fusiformis TaxID=6347 RepID=A0A8J1UXX6_OWEFU|nr:unnamed protein product [Owenia fusiformis]
MENIKLKMGFDDLIPELGGDGRYQALAVISFLLFYAATAWQYNITVFIAAHMQHWCHVPELAHLNHTTFMHIAVPLEENQFGEAMYSQCRVYDLNYSSVTAEGVTNWIPNGNTSTRKCNGYVYDTSRFTSTLVSQYDLVCDRKWLYTLAASAFMAGLFCGAFCSGALADRFGRQRTCFIMFALHFLTTMGAAVVPDYAAFLVLRGLVGASGLGAYTTLYAYNLEAMSKEARSKAFYIIMMGRLAKGGLVFLAYFIRNHIHLQIAASVCLLPGLIVVFFLPESPRWLMATGRWNEAEAVCKKIARINRVKLSEDFNLDKYREAYYENKTCEENEDNGKTNATILDLFRTPRLRKRTILTYCMWFTMIFLAFGIDLNVEKIIPGDVYLNMLSMTCLNELGGFVTGYIAIFKMKRRIVVTTWFIIAGVCVIAMAPLMLLGIPGIITALGLIGAMLVTNLWCLVYLFSGELFPTVARSVGMGSGSSLSRLGGLITPQLPLLGDIWYGLPYIVLGVVAILGGILVLCLPETKNRRLPDTLQEAEIFGTAKYDQDYAMDTATSIQAPLKEDGAQEENESML